MRNRGKDLERIDDPLILADLYSETIGGGTNSVAALGNGRLTVGVSPWSELVYFRWPNLSHYDHLRYVTVSRGLLHGLSVRDVRHGRDAPCSDWWKYGRPLEKHRGLGAKTGIYTSRQGLLWADDPVWKSSRRYDPEGSPFLVTELQCSTSASGPPTTLRIRQWVMPDTDLLIQQCRVEAQDMESLFFHATFAPSLRIERGISNRDSRKSGFACAFCPGEELILWFRPKVLSAKRLSSLGREPLEPARLDSAYPEGGVFIALGSLEPVDRFQVGADQAGRRKNSRAPAGARLDAADGSLQGNPFFRGPADAGIRINLKESGPSPTLLIAVAGSACGAAGIIRRAREDGIAEVEERAGRLWEPVAKKIFLPRECSVHEGRVARRSILNLLAGRDPETGALVASPSRQPRYCYDWPRDGAFFDMALDLAGFPEMVDAHLSFYRRTQRRSALAFSPTWFVSLRFPLYCPRGHWFSNMHTDGSPGFFKLIPIEIDETSLLVWDLWRHERYVPEREKDTYRKTYGEMLRLAVHAILRFVDLKRGWTKKVMEDDDPVAKATLHGASAVLAGLAAAVDLAERWSIDGKTVAGWRKAARRLREGMLERIQSAEVLEAAGWRGLRWCLFPAPLFEDSSQPGFREILQRLAGDMERKVRRESGGIGYLGEQLFVFALSTRNLPEYRDLKESVIRVLTVDAPVEGTDCFGEVGIWKRTEDPVRFFIQNRTAIPHLWSGITVYLSVLAMHRPELIESLRPPIP